MKSLPSGMQAHLDSGATTLCWCWRVTRADGVVLGFTDHDRDVTFNGVAHEAQAGLTASEAQAQLGFAPDNGEVAGALRSDRISEADIALGRYDGAVVDLYRVNWSQPAQHVHMRRLTFGDIKRGKHSFTAELRGQAARLSEVQGRLFRHGCDAKLGETRCGVNLASSAYGAVGTVRKVISATSLELNWSGGFADGFFARGGLTFTTGTLRDLTFDVRDHERTGFGGLVGLWIGPDILPSVGDGIRIVAGCDKSFDTCRSKFANHLNFRGFPHIPGNDFVFRFPRQDEAENDGKSLVNG